ncbi:MAG TPA: hypothetical protein VF715_18235 [Thermoleophilaceae bacterium]
MWGHTGARLLVVACALLAFGPAAGASGAQLYAPDSYVNRVLPANAPLDPLSPLMVQRLVSQVQESHAWIGTTDYYDFGVPIYNVPANQPTVTVHTTHPGLAPQFAAVPLPADAFPDPGSDGNLVVYQESTDTTWEFWQLKKDAAGNWSAAYGGRMQNVSSNPGYYTDPPGSQYGARATSIPMLAGVLRIAELQAREINHAIGFGMPRPAPCYRWPAQRQDADLSNSDWLAPPEGAILRLPADLDLDSLNMPPLTRAIARAVQRHGMVLQDRGGNVGFQGEDPRPVSPNPYAGPNGIFEGTSPSHLLSFFPWDKLQVLAVPPGKSSCEKLNGTAYSVPPLQ